MPETHLLLYLDGPMQSWGSSSRFGRRTTLAFPTRSGVTGLLAAAMGVQRGNTGALAELARLRMEVVALEKERRPFQRWTDYHTVGGGYDLDTHRLQIPRTANTGKPRGTVLTSREYLSDARFGVLFIGDGELLKRCQAALLDPVWGAWLGRKCCIPGDIVCQGLHGSREQALARLLEISGGRVTRVVREVEAFEDGTDTLADMPVNFAEREFNIRRIAESAE